MSSFRGPPKKQGCFFGLPFNPPSPPRPSNRRATRSPPSAPKERFGAFSALLGPGLGFAGCDVCGSCVTLRPISGARRKTRRWVPWLGSLGSLQSLQRIATCLGSMVDASLTQIHATRRRGRGDFSITLWAAAMSFLGDAREQYKAPCQLQIEQQPGRCGVIYFGITLRSACLGLANFTDLYASLSRNSARCPLFAVCGV